MTAEREALTPREIADKIVADASMRMVCMKPMYDSVDLGEALIKRAIDEALATTRVDADAEWLLTNIAPKVHGQLRWGVERIASRLSPVEGE